MNVKFGMTPKCSSCGNRYNIGNTNGMPNMIGFQQKSGKTINLCYKCLIKLGQMSEEDQEKFISEMDNE